MDESKPETFGSAARRKCHDASADELIRFVRDFQRHGVQKVPTSNGMVRKAVLPTIKSRRSSEQSSSTSTRIDRRKISDCTNGENFDKFSQMNSDVFYKNHIQPTSDDACLVDDVFDDYSHDINDTDDYNDTTALPQAPTAYREDEADLSSLDPRTNPNVTASFEQTQFPNPHLTLSFEQFQARGNEVLTFDMKKGSNSDRFFKASRGLPQYTITQVRQFMNPRALAQLPPIVRKDLPERPSAPLPTCKTPSSTSALESDDEEDDDLFQQINSGSEFEESSDEGDDGDNASSNNNI